MIVVLARLATFFTMVKYMDGFFSKKMLLLLSCRKFETTDAAGHNFLHDPTYVYAYVPVGTYSSSNKLVKLQLHILTRIYR